jgi:hypothetical protein
MANQFFSPLPPPNGSVLPNLIAKAAISENMASKGQLQNQRIEGLISLAYFERQLQRIGAGKEPKPSINLILTFIRHLIRNKAITYRYLSWAKNPI